MTLLKFFLLKDIFVKFGIFSDTETVKTDIVKKQNDKQSDKIDFKFSKQFDFVVTPEVTL
jgi:hypothetical protein